MSSKAGPCSVGLLQNKRNFSFGCVVYLLWNWSRREHLAQWVGGLSRSWVWFNRWGNVYSLKGLPWSWQQPLRKTFFSSRDSKALEQRSSLIFVTVNNGVLFLSSGDAASCVVIFFPSWLYISDMNSPSGCNDLDLERPWGDKRGHVCNYLHDMFRCHCLSITG